MRTRHLGSIGIALAALAVLPLRSDGSGSGGLDECCNVSTSLASAINAPTAGDEQFFTLPVGPANIMLLLDSSGSMDNLPQCGDMSGAWGNWDIAGKPSCIFPQSMTPPPADRASTVGTCDVTGNAQLSWMNAFTPTRTLPDPGNGTVFFDAPLNTVGLVDRPTWGSTCTGNNCLFNPDGYYSYGDWTETGATQREDCTAYDASGAVTNLGGLALSQEPRIRSCGPVWTRFVLPPLICLYVTSKK